MRLEPLVVLVAVGLVVERREMESDSKSKENEPWKHCLSMVDE